MFCLFVFLVCYYGILYQSHVFFPPRSVITPDSNFSSVAPNGAVGGGPHRPPLPHPGYPAWPHATPYRGPLYRPGSFYCPPPPPMYRGYYPPPMPAPPPFHPAAGGPPFPPRGAVPPMPRPLQEADGRGIHQTGKPDAQHSQAGPFRPDQMAPHQPINRLEPRTSSSAMATNSAGDGGVASGQVEDGRDVMNMSQPVRRSS